MFTKPEVLLCFAIVSSGLMAGCTTGSPPRIPRDTPSSDTAAYSIKNLGTLGGNSSTATAINASGQVVGEAATAAGERHAFLYTGGKMKDLGTLPGYAFSRATGINASGQIVGWVDNSVLEQPHAFIYSEGQMRRIGALAGKTSKAYAINAAGDIVGEAEPYGQRHAFLYIGGRMRDPDTLCGAYGLNDAGLVVGVSGVTVGDRVPFIYDSDKIVTLDISEPIPLYPPDPSAHEAPRGGSRRMYQIGEATAINLAGQIVGFMGYVTQWSSDHAFLYSDGKMQDLGTLGGNAPFSQARAINALGQIVGMSGSHPPDNNRSDSERAFFYGGGQMSDLRQLIGEAALATAGFKALSVANSINDRGQIAGVGIDLKGNETAFLLTPIRQK